MKTVWKFPLPVSDIIQIKMPTGAKILSVQSQHGDDLTLWAEVESENEPKNRSFVVFGTGHKIPDQMVLEFIGTVQLGRGALVLHVYELLKIYENQPIY